MSSPAERGGAHGAGEVTGTDRLGEDAARAYLDAVERQRSALRRRPVAAAAKRTSTDARLACACCPSCSRPSGQTTSSRSRTSTHTQGARAAKRSVFVARRGSRERAEQQSHHRVWYLLDLASSQRVQRSAPRTSAAPAPNAAYARPKRPRRAKPSPGVRAHSLAISRTRDHLETTTSGRSPARSARATGRAPGRPVRPVHSSSTPRAYRWCKAGS